MSRWDILIFVCTLAAFLPAMVNSFIHVLMYSYYGLAALGPSVTKYLWWKKYLTILQLIQFTTALILGINGIRSGCDFPLWMQYALVIYMLSFIVLFGNFYAKAYIAKVRRLFCMQPERFISCLYVCIIGPWLTFVCRVNRYMRRSNSRG